MTKLLSSAGNAKAHVYLNHHRLRFIRNLRLESLENNYVWCRWSKQPTFSYHPTSLHLDILLRYPHPVEG